MKQFLFFLTILLGLQFQARAKEGDRLRYLPVQDAGRIKPFDTFAKETLELIYGKKTYKESESKPSVEAQWVVLTWMLAPESWAKRPLFEVKHHDLLAQLGLPKEQKHFTGEQLFQSEKFSNLMQDLQNKRESKEKLTPFYQALQRIENQFILFREMASGRLLKIYPVPNSDTWLSIAELPPEAQTSFLEISKAVANYLGAQTESSTTAEQKIQLEKALDAAVTHFQAKAKQSDPAKYELTSKVETEVLYNDIHPFRIAYLFYLLSALVLLYLWIRNAPKGMAIAWGLLLTGFSIHTLGFIFRVYLAERPPVSNMYETVVWASWGTVLFSIVLELFYKFRVMLLAGSLMGLFALVIADSAPAILDPSLQPLEAVLRSNYWLIVHVMTISISYAAFLLAFGLGDLGLIYYVIDAKKYEDRIQKITTGVYRAMQIGVGFLAPGIILGGIWADYSWGRFWGWDPKETWALIVLLGYIVVLHARLVGWLKNFGTLASGVITFSLVIMAWYGVNFVLGAGLHSYGFGAGGIEYVSIFVLLHLLFVLYAYLTNRLQKPA
ncbi:MAG: cytochrome c biogenesis protein CcsA [Bdellovibrionaceae bacterium]|nr:cytochrome c biogenesis protein CcsA [Bdellovibrio sp.]